jgi:hypothetical protein
MTNWKQNLVLFAAALAVPAMAWGQGAVGTITGNITDASGAAVSGARVTAANTGTGHHNQRHRSVSLRGFAARHIHHNRRSDWLSEDDSIRAAASGSEHLAHGRKPGGRRGYDFHHSGVRGATS